MSRARRDLPRIDTQAVRDAHDCREVIASLIGPPHSGGSASHAWTWRCPFHNEQHGYALVAWQDGWACYGSCGDAGDVIQFIVKYKHLRFFEAVKVLQGDHLPTQGADYVAPERVERDFQLPPEAWRGAVALFVPWAQKRLAQMPHIMRYLTEQRLLSEETIRLAHLGASPGQYFGWTKQFGLLHQHGIILPWAVGQDYCALNVRRLLPENRTDEHKYRQVQGSMKGLYGINHVVDDGRPLVFAEGEFDCLLLRQFVADRASVVTLGGCSDKLYPRWRYLNDGRPWLVAHDADAAGQNLLKYLQSINPAARPLPVPCGKDVTEYVRSLPGSLEEVAVQVRRWFGSLV